ncbi:serine/threonine protein kinase, partial [Bifidobacteriaceae bacterium WP022]
MVFYLPSQTSHTVLIPKASALKSAPLQKTVDDLRKQGVKVIIVKEFSSVKRGGFVRFTNVRPGQRVQSSSHVTVIESKGPGIPKKGVVGQPLEKAKKIAESMG